MLSRNYNKVIHCSSQHVSNPLGLIGMMASGFCRVSGCITLLLPTFQAQGYSTAFKGSARDSDFEFTQRVSQLDYVSEVGVLQSLSTQKLVQAHSLDVITLGDSAQRVYIRKAYLSVTRRSITKVVQLRVETADVAIRMIIDVIPTQVVLLAPDYPYIILVQMPCANFCYLGRRQKKGYNVSELSKTRAMRGKLFPLGAIFGDSGVESTPAIRHQCKCCA